MSTEAPSTLSTEQALCNNGNDISQCCSGSSCTGDPIGSGCTDMEGSFTANVHEPAEIKGPSGQVIGTVLLRRSAICRNAVWAVVYTHLTQEVPIQGYLSRRGSCDVINPYSVNGLGVRTDMHEQVAGIQACGVITLGTTSYKACTANNPPWCGTGTANPSTVWPPNHAMVSISIDHAFDPDGDGELESASVTQVTQDEVVCGEGTPRTATADAVFGEGLSFQVKAERSGQGDGRSYIAQFQLTDCKGASCTEQVEVCVPHSDGGSCGASAETPYISNVASGDCRNP